jgi:hypothetical protein
MEQILAAHNRVGRHPHADDCASNRKKWILEKGLGLKRIGCARDCGLSRA